MGARLMITETHNNIAESRLSINGRDLMEIISMMSFSVYIDNLMTRQVDSQEYMIEYSDLNAQSSSYMNMMTIHLC